MTSTSRDGSTLEAFRNRLDCGEFLDHGSATARITGLAPMLTRCLDAFPEEHPIDVACFVIHTRLHAYATRPELFSAPVHPSSICTSERAAQFVVYAWAIILRVEELRRRLPIPEHLSANLDAAKQLCSAWYAPFEARLNGYIAGAHNDGPTDPRPLILCAIHRGMGHDVDAQSDPIVYLELRRWALLEHEDRAAELDASLIATGNGIANSILMRDHASRIAERFSKRLRADGSGRCSEEEILGWLWELAKAASASKHSFAVLGSDDSPSTTPAPGTAFRESRIEDRLFPTLGKRRRKNRTGSEEPRIEGMHEVDSGRPTTARWRDCPLNSALKNSAASRERGIDPTAIALDKRSSDSARSERVTIIRSIREYRRRQAEDSSRRAATRWLLNLWRGRPATLADIAIRFGVERSRLGKLTVGFKNGKGLCAAELREIVKKISE